MPCAPAAPSAKEPEASAPGAERDRRRPAPLTRSPGKQEHRGVSLTLRAVVAYNRGMTTEEREDSFTVAGRRMTSRLIVGTGKYATYDLMRDCLEASAAEVITVAVRRERLIDAAGRNILDYIDLGSPRGDFGGSGDSGQYQLDLAGIGGYAIGTLPIGIFELSGKVGYYFHDLEINVDLDNFGSGNGDVLDSDESGEALVYGVGAGVTLFEQLNAKIEYELFDVDRLDDSYAFWLTAAWRF